MSLWRKFRSRLARKPPNEVVAEPDPKVVPPPPSAAAPAESAPTSDALLRKLLAARDRPDELSVLAAVLERPDLWNDDLRILLADLLAIRGDRQRAADVLRDATAPAGLLQRAELLEICGRHAEALTVVERVLAVDFDAPGARESRRRLVQMLGLDRRVVASEELTTMAPASGRAAFRLVQEVARGGAGVVYEAQDPILGRTLAYKIYHRGESDSATILREVRLTSQLAGNGVVRVLDASPEAGWVALEWAPLGSLKGLMGSRSPLLSPIATWLIPLASALARVHQAGFVHGDIKPANVLFRAPDQPVLTDFGLARAIGETLLGGSAGYLAPERIQPVCAAPSADVFGFGRILHEVLEVAPLSDEVLGALQAIVTSCLAAQAERPADGLALLAVLREAFGNP